MKALMMLRPEGFKAIKGGVRSAAALRTLSVLLALAFLSCSGGGDDVRVMEDPLFGFYLGEKKDDLFQRVRYITSWRKVEGSRTAYRGELYELSRAGDRSREVEKVRLSFVDGHLAEIVAYMKMTNVSQLNALKKRYTEEYGVEATSPDGSIEMAYKTYWIKAPGMSITIRRITKNPRDELYVQFLHDGLFEKIKK